MKVKDSCKNDLIVDKIVKLLYKIRKTEGNTGDSVLQVKQKKRSFH